MSNQVTAVILAAGQGKRMCSTTPKVMQPLAGLPMLSYVIKTAQRITSNIVVVIGPDHQGIQDAFPYCTHVVQPAAKGTADALKYGLSAVKTPRVLVLCGDVPLIESHTLEQLIHKKSTALLTAMVKNPFGFGRIIRKDNQVLGIVEEKDASVEEKKIQEINAGVYCFETKKVQSWIEKVQPNNQQKEWYLTDVVAMAATETGVESLCVDEKEIIGINTQNARSYVEKIIVQKNTKKYMEKGLFVQNPDSVWIEGDLQFGQDVWIEPGVILKGTIELGSSVRIGAYSVLENVVIETGAHIAPHSILENCIVRKGAKVGPFARVRPESDIGPDARVGNFVEIKKTTLGAHSKVNHLSYIGDSQIGEKVNIGAGTITCNYDGKNKNTTNIGHGAFIGSGVMLVAPIKIGEGATIGAGSTVTENAPDGKLTLARSKQVTIEGWRRSSHKEEK